MYIESAKGILPFEASDYVNKVGKYIYRKLKESGSAYKMTTEPNICSVYFYVQYQFKEVGEDEQFSLFDRVLDEVCPFHKIPTVVDITTYQNKIRLNIITLDPLEKTVGHMVLKPEDLTDYNKALQKFKVYIENQLEKEYKGYAFWF